MELQRLRYLVAVSEELHFGRAAKRLLVAQPSLSVQIRKLEQHLGAPLFLRDQAVELTAAGRALLPRAREILAEVDALPEVVRRAAAADQSIGIGYVPYARSSAFTPILEEFRRARPEVRVVLHAANDSPSVLELLRDASIDVGLLRSPVSAEWIGQVPVTTEPFMVALPRGHRLCAFTEIRLLDLRDEPFAMFGSDLNTEAFDDLMGFFARAGFAPRIAHRSRRMDESLAFVATGGGVALFPRSVSETTSDPNLEFRLVVEPTPSVEIVLAWDRGRPNSVVDAVVEIALALQAAANR